MSWGPIQGNKGPEMKWVEAKPTGKGKSKPEYLQVARRESATSTVAVPDSGSRDFERHLAEIPHFTGAGPIKTPFPEAYRPNEPVPIWFSVLLAVSCSAKRNGEQHSVRWSCDAGRATYTNLGGEVERIEPLGVSLLGGHTMAVYWNPGETAYTVEVYRQKEKCA
jgi:hypothetical protein